MNKLIIDNVVDLNDLIITEDTMLINRLDNVSDTINISILDNICLYEISLLKNTKNKVIYHLGENSKAIINKIAIDNSDDVSVYLDKENANVTINNSLINYQNNTYISKVYHHSCNTISNIVNHALNIQDQDFSFNVDVIIPKESINSSTNQDNKIISMGNGQNLIKPNLLIDNQMIEANHSAYIGEFDKNVVFYLMTRGLSKKTIIDMLSLGFLLNRMNLFEFKDEVINFIKNNI